MKNKAEKFYTVKKPKEKMTHCRVEYELAEQVRKVLPDFSQKVGFKVSFQGFVEKAIRECVEREKPKENI